jgi:MFS family permease
MPTFSLLSDRVGRKRWFTIGAVLMAAFAFPYFMLLNTKNPVVVVIAIALSLCIFHAWLYGPEAAFISERFGTKLRYSGASLGYQLASLTAGGPAPIIAVALFATYHSYVPISLYIIGMAVITLLALIGLREYTRQETVEDKEPASAVV